MITWLDQIIQTIGRETRLCQANDPTVRRLTDFQIMRQLTREAATQCVIAANEGKRAPGSIEHLGAIHAFFARPEELQIAPYACAVGRDLARTFSGAVASPEVKRRAEAFAKEKILTYIDVADRALRLGHTYHLKALIVLRVPRPGRYVGSKAADPWIPDDTDRIRIIATVGAIGELAQVHLDWTAENRNFRCNESAAAMLQGVEDGIDGVATEIENLVWLTLAYAAVAEPRDRVRLPAAPDHLRESQNRATKRRWRQFTLFQVERLRPPADNFGRRDGGGREEWQLGRRIAVQGHFKMQPHGHGSRERKLIFVGDYFRGPLDSAPIHKMTALIPQH